MDKDEILANLAQLAIELDELHKAITLDVVSARAAGSSWSEIGRKLGISKQAAQQKYGSKVASAPAPAAVDNVWLSTSITSPAPAPAPVDVLAGLGASDITRRFYDKAKELGVDVEVMFDAATDNLRVLVVNHSAGGGWTCLYQWPGARPGTHRHYWDVARMRAAPAQKKTRYDAYKAIETYQP